MLQVSGLKKRFGAHQAVNGVSFKVEKGQCVGLLGPNGAGKTTTVSMITGLLKPDAGEIRVDGAALQGDADPRKRKVGLVPQELALYDELSAEANLSLFGALYDLGGAALTEAVDRVLGVVELKDRARHKVATFSGGMKRRLNLAAALMHRPELVILDEPTVGVDPQSRNAIFDNLEKIRAEGATLLYTTHYMEEAERLCDRIVIVDHGEVKADDTLRGLYKLLPPTNKLTVELATPPTPALAKALEAVPGIAGASVDGERLVISVRGMEMAPGALAALVQQGQKVVHVESDRPSLESVFLTLTGRKLRDA